jgi:hypothetical protein
MKSRMFLAVLFVAAYSLAQTTTTQTNCSIYGSTASCTSTSTSDAAAQAAQAERNREMYESGQKMGQSAGNLIQNIRARHFVKKFCEKNGAGATWWYQFQGQQRITGTCEDQQAANSIPAASPTATVDKWQDTGFVAAMKDNCSHKWFADSHADDCSKAVQKALAERREGEVSAACPAKPTATVDKWQDTGFVAAMKDNCSHKWFADSHADDCSKVVQACVSR